ncbi:S9 family peptidase [Microbacterium sp. 1P10UB]|uniref:S9 family peptidase n=1 Tax=unclassified Microbacterium TaxID=2609290 RepID=UPI0039A2B4FC
MRVVDSGSESGGSPVLATDLTEIWTPVEVRLQPRAGRVLILETRPDVDENTYVGRLLLGDAGGADLTEVDAGRGVGPVAFSPSGEALAWAATRDGRSAVRLLDLRPDETREAREVAALPDGIEELAWSPDGATLAVVARVPDDRTWWEAPVDRRPPLVIETLRFKADGVGWTVNTRRQLFLVDVASGDVRRVSDGTADDHGVAWEDGGHLLFVSQRQPDRDLTEANALFRLRLEDGSVEQITDATRELSGPVLSPAGSRAAVIAVELQSYPSTSHPALVDLATGGVTDLRGVVDRDGAASSLRWVSDDAFTVVVGSEGRMEVVEISCAPASAPSARTILTGQRHLTAHDADGDRWIAVEATPSTPPRVITGSRTNAAERVIHDPNAAYRARHRFIEPRHVPVDVDGTTLDSWVAVPPGGGPHPLIVWLQGGGTQYGYQWSHEVQLLLAAGYAVCWLNPRGSAGYGTAWMKVNAAPGAAEPGEGWGTRDLADIVAVVEHLIGSEDVDAARVGVMGGSYGGMMTAMLLARTDLFAAGWAERGPYNLLSDAATKDEAPWFFEQYLGVSHLDDAAPYWDASPLKFVHGITAPLAIVHSEEDWRCSIQQAEELFFALRVLGRPVRFIRFPGEGHSLTRTGSPVHRVQRGELLVDWFGEKLTPAPEPTPAGAAS